MMLVMVCLSLLQHQALLVAFKKHVALLCGVQAVREDWYFQMYYDDLPVWGFIGKMEKIISAGTRPQYK